MNPLITQKEAAEKYQISDRTVSAKLKRAKIKPVLKIKHIYMYDPQQLHQALTIKTKKIEISKEAQFNLACRQFITRKPNKC